MENKKRYRILPEFVDEWTNSDNPEDWIVDLPEIQRLAAEWGTTEAELMEQVEEIEHVDKFEIFETSAGIVFFGSFRKNVPAYCFADYGDDIKAALRDAFKVACGYDPETDFEYNFFDEYEESPEKVYLHFLEDRDEDPIIIDNENVYIQKMSLTAREVLGIPEGEEREQIQLLDILEYLR